MNVIKTRVRPGKQWLFAIGGLIFLYGVAFFIQWSYQDLASTLNTASTALFVALLFLVVLDLRSSLNRIKPSISRFVPRNLALDRVADIQLKIEIDKAIPVEIYDHFSPEGECHDMPIKITGSHELQYQWTPKKRGLISFNECSLRWGSFFRFWMIERQYAIYNDCRVYPDFERIRSELLQSNQNHNIRSGIRKKPRRGLGLDFHQLREYRQGDSHKQVDWKATSRRLQLISREYQDEQDQQVVFLIDSGRRMMDNESGISHFDRALNALLMVAHVALKQGDSVAMMSYGAEQRWVPPLKGHHQVNRLLNAFYDLEAKPVASDLQKAVETLQSHQTRRALIILVTNLRDDNLDEILAPIQTLKKRHLVMLSNIQEHFLKPGQIENPSDKYNLDHEVLLAGVEDYKIRRANINKKLKHLGVISLDEQAEYLLPAITQAYLQVKAERRL